jgi:hypothetical protein
MIDQFRESSVLKLYPDPADIFVPDEVDLARHLHPLLSVDIGVVNPAWSGWLHVLSPLEPFEGHVGDATEPFHSPLLRTNWIGFRIENGRYRLSGDPRFFALETPERLAPDFLQQLKKHYSAEEDSYRAIRAGYRQHGKLLRRPDYHPGKFFDELGEGNGGPDGNWTMSEFPTSSVTFDRRGPTRYWPLSPSGRKFEFIILVAGWNYRESGAGILLFYEPVERLALLTFEWD